MPGLPNADAFFDALPAEAYEAAIADVSGSFFGGGFAYHWRNRWEAGASLHSRSWAGLLLEHFRAAAAARACVAKE